MLNASAQGFRESLNTRRVPLEGVLSQDTWNTGLQERVELLQRSAANSSPKHHKALSSNRNLNQDLWWHIFENNTDLEVRRNLALNARNQEQFNALLEDEKRSTVLDLVVSRVKLNSEQIALLEKKMTRGSAQNLLREGKIAHENVLQFAEKLKFEERVLYWSVAESTVEDEEKMLERLKKENFTAISGGSLGAFAVLLSMKPHVGRNMLLRKQNLLNMLQSKHCITLAKLCGANININWETEGAEVLENLVGVGAVKSLLEGIAYNIYNTPQSIQNFLDKHDLAKLVPNKGKHTLKQRNGTKTVALNQENGNKEVVNFLCATNGDYQVKAGLRVYMLAYGETGTAEKELLKTRLGSSHYILGSSMVDEAGERRSWWDHYTNKMPPIQGVSTEVEVQPRRAGYRAAGNWKDVEAALTILPATREAHETFLKLYNSESLTLKQVAESIEKL